jgi:hypothetical protein
MGQFNWFWPVWSESQKQQREDAKKFKFLTQDSEKVDCRDSMRQKKKSKPSVCADETGRQKKKNCAKEKFCAPVSLTLLHGSDKKNIFLAARVTQRLVTRTKGCAHGSRVWLWPKKNCARSCCWPEATGQEKKSLAPLTRMHGCEEKWPNREKKSAAWRAGWAEVTEQKRKKILHVQQLLTGHHRKRFCARSRMRPDSDQIKDSARAGWQCCAEASKKNLRAPSEWKWPDRERRKKNCTPGRQQKWKRPVKREKDVARSAGCDR